MIIWSRWGIVVLLFVGLGVALGFLLMAALGIRENSGAVPGIFIGIGFILCAVALFFFDREVLQKHLDKPRAAVIYEGGRAIPVLHPETGQQLVTQPSSSFFFIPVKYWVYVLPAIGLLLLVINTIVVLTGG